LGESKTPPHTVKVVDRRKFTASGEPREDVRTVTSTEAPSGPPDREQPSGGAVPGNAKPPVGRPPEPEAPVSEVPRGPDARQAMPAQTSPELLELIGMLAQNAELLLVGGDDIPAQPAEARRVIDWLAALERKTAGNLSAEEQKFLTEIVFQLRSFYVQRSK